MEHLADVSLDELRTALDDVEDATAAQRLVAAIAYKRGTTQTELAEWFGVERRTIYAWLARLDGAALADSARDDRRPGRPPKLGESELENLTEALRDPPTASGYDDRWWTPALVRRHVRETYDVTYSLPSCRRLLESAGLGYRESEPSNEEAKPDVDGAPPEETRQADDGPGGRDGVWIPQ